MLAPVILSDRSLREQIEAGRIVIEPFDESCVQPSSIDVKIGNLFRVFRNHTSGVIDVKQNQQDLTELVTIPEGGVFMLHPGEFVLGSTLERIAVPDDLVSRIEGKALATSTEIPTPNQLMWLLKKPLLNGLDIWMIFKLFIVMPLTSLYFIWQVRLMQKVRLPEKVRS